MKLITDIPSTEWVPGVIETLTSGMFNGCFVAVLGERRQWQPCGAPWALPTIYCAHHAAESSKKELLFAEDISEPAHRPPLKRKPSRKKVEISVADLDADIRAAKERTQADQVKANEVIMATEGIASRAAPSWAEPEVRSGRRVVLDEELNTCASRMASDHTRWRQRRGYRQLWKQYA